jgi:hypothetical protein
MPLIARHTVIVAALLVAAAAGNAQLITESGMASGSGLAYLPSPGMVPPAHWRANYARVDYLGAGARGMNVLGMEYGLSANLEGYVRLTGEQLGTVSSLSAFGFGLKGLIPAQAGPVRAAGVWFETTTSDDFQSSRFFPANSSRGGLLLSFGGYALNPILLAGAAWSGGEMRALAGAGVTVAPASGIQVGAEVLKGYADGSSTHLGLDVSARVAPHVAVLVNPGYISIAGERTWALSVGIAVSTADVDFRPAAATLSKDDFRLPSLEDIMKQSPEEKKQ